MFVDWQLFQPQKLGIVRVYTVRQNQSNEIQEVPGECEKS